MNVNRTVYSRQLKHIFLISLVFCVVTVLVIENRAKNFTIIVDDLDPLTDSTPFLQEIRNSWLEYDVGDVAIYILSAIGSNSTEHMKHERNIKLHGWLDGKDQNKRIKCCFLWNNGTVSKVDNPAVIKRQRTELVASQIACPLNASHSDVTGVTVQSVKSTCPAANDKTYIKPYLPKKANGDESFAICLKLVYGNVDNALFIDWLEFYRVIKVDKVFMFTYNISETTIAIIRHYVRLGFVESKPFNHPEITRGQIGQKRKSYFEDERVIIFDCLQRSSSYKYVAIIDMDEFLLPRKHENIKQLMKYLMKRRPRAAGFHLQSYIFVNRGEPGTQASRNGSDIVNYFRRTTEMNGQIARRKNILLPSRITLDGLYTHRFKPAKNYSSFTIKTSIAAINHYRTCYPNAADTFCSGELTTDKYILKFVKKFPERTWRPDG